MFSDEAVCVDHHVNMKSSADPVFSILNKQCNTKLDREGSNNDFGIDFCTE
jgi:hypothetical protein